jgi:hypothetical protein
VPTAAPTTDGPYICIEFSTSTLPENKLTRMNAMHTYRRGQRCRCISAIDCCQRTAQVARFASPYSATAAGRFPRYLVSFRQSNQSYTRHTRRRAPPSIVCACAYCIPHVHLYMVVYMFCTTNSQLGEAQLSSTPLDSLCHRAL